MYLLIHIFHLSYALLLTNYHMCPTNFMCYNRYVTETQDCYLMFLEMLEQIKYDFKIWNGKISVHSIFCNFAMVVFILWNNKYWFLSIGILTVFFLKKTEASTIIPVDCSYYIKMLLNKFRIRAFFCYLIYEDMELYMEGLLQACAGLNKVLTGFRPIPLNFVC